MEAASGKKGMVVSLSSMFPAEEAQKAAQCVQEAISEKRKELDTVNNFIADNTNLINLVQRLPDELHHHIMVPFGKAAFFPGRLVHTNEFMVLLGEGYYAERTSKQTVDILKRREKTLESQVDSLKALIEDLKIEASFFDRTAAEAAEGLVDIREDYTDEDSVETNSTLGPQIADASRPSEKDVGGGALDDEEYARIMSRFDELEREELEAGDIEEVESDERDESSDNLENTTVQPHAGELSNTSQPGDSDSDLENLSLRSRNIDESRRGKAVMQPEASKLPEKDYVQPSILKMSSQSNLRSKKVSFQIPEPDGCSHIFGQVTESLKSTAQRPKLDTGNRVSRPNNDSMKAFPGSIVERMNNLPLNTNKQTTSRASAEISRPESGSQPFRASTDSLKAFSGTIVERTDNLPSNPEKQTTSQPSSSQSSRPVSRFKMQRRAQGLN